MASVMKLLRRIGGAKAAPTGGEAGELAIYKAGATPTDAMSLYAHDGTQWLEVLDTRGKTMSVPVFTDATTAPASPRFGDFWLNTGTNLLSIWDGATWLSTDPHPVATGTAAPTAPTSGALWLDPVKKELQVWDGTRWAHVAFTNVQNTFTKSQIIDANSASAALHIKQLGTGAALLVEDEANPDASPFVVDQNGNVGIGTATPARQFVVSDAGGVGFEIGPAALGDGSVSLLAYDRKTNLDVPIRLSSKSFSFESLTRARLAIAETGHVHINYQAAPAAPTTLAIKSYGDDGDFAIDVKSASDVELFKVRDDGAAFIGKNGKSPINLTTASAANLYIDAISGLLQRSTSSLRYKRDVVDYDKGIDAVKALRPVYYKQKGTDIDGEPVNTQYAGLIAEEVDAAGLHEFVQYDSQGRPDALHYANMIALLVKAVQELSAKVEKLEARP